MNKMTIKAYVNSFSSTLNRSKARIGCESCILVNGRTSAENLRESKPLFISKLIERNNVRISILLLPSEKKKTKYKDSRQIAYCTL